MRFAFINQQYISSLSFVGDALPPQCSSPLCVCHYQQTSPSVLYLPRGAHLEHLLLLGFLLPPDPWKPAVPNLFCFKRGGCVLHCIFIALLGSSLLSLKECSLGGGCAKLSDCLSQSNKRGGAAAMWIRMMLQHPWWPAEIQCRRKKEGDGDKTRQQKPGALICQHLMIMGVCIFGDWPGHS